MKLWISLLLFLFGCIFLYFAFKKKRELFHDLSGKDIFNMIVGLLLVLVPLIIGNLPENDSPDYEALNRPYLEPQLVVDSISSEQFKYHYEIRNSGKLPAKNLQLLFSSKDTSGKIESPLHPFDLAPGGSMAFKMPVLFEKKITTNKTFITLMLYCMYTATINEKERSFNSRFDFSMFSDEITKNEFTYNYSTREDGILSIQKQKEILGLKEALNSAVGSFGLWFNISDHDKGEKYYLANSPSKALMYLPDKKQISFHIKKKDQKDVALVQSIDDPEKNWHFIAITWSDVSASIYVDSNGYTVSADGTVQKHKFTDEGVETHKLD